jgi:hypothetical protein
MIQDENRGYDVNTLKMEAAVVSQTLEIQYVWTKLKAWKDFIGFIINKKNSDPLHLEGSYGSF